MAAGAPVEWKSFSIVARVGFFILAVICAGGLAGFVYVVTNSEKAAMLVTALAALGIAEFLIGVYRFFRAGFDEAAWLGGAVALALFFAAFNNGWRTAVAMLGIAFLAAAIRLLNPLFATAGMVILPIATDSEHTATICYVVTAIVAFVLLPFPRRRPSFEFTLGALAVVMPLAAYLAAKDGQSRFSPAIAAALLIYAAAALVVGLRFRLHAPLLALFPVLGCFAYEVRDLTGMSLEARLVVWGSILLGVSIAIDRYLKTPRNGITSRQLKDDRLGDLLQLAGTIVITPHEKPPEPVQGGPQLETGGSSFGGAGAGGNF